MTRPNKKLSPFFWAALFLLFSSYACLPSGYNTRPSLIQWRTLEDGKMAAKDQGKPVLVDFSTRVECMRCEFFEKTLYTDPDIADPVNRDFIPVRVNLNQALTESEAALLEILSPSQECVLAFLDKDGAIVTDKKGQPISSLEKLTKAQYLSYMAKALENLP